nr:alpha/beta hydrolase [Allomuricauda sp.]
MKTIKFNGFIRSLFLGLCVIHATFSFGRETPNRNLGELKTENGVWRYETSGTGMKGLIFIHGEGGNRNVWRNQELLKLQGFKNIYLDLLGYGSSDKSKKEYSLKMWLDGIHEIVHKEQLETLVFVTYGHGRIIAKEYCRNYPNDIEHLILINGPNQENMQLEGIDSIQKQTASLKETADGTLENSEPSYYSKGHLIRESKTNNKIKRRAKNKINCPVTVISGKGKRISKKGKRQLKRVIPDVLILEGQDMGCLPQANDAMRINSIIAKHALLQRPKK